jgi:hypothetical protein
MEPCDCLDHCGTDPWLRDGRATPCANLVAWRARPHIVGVGRDAADANVLVVVYDKPPTDADLRHLRTCDRWRQP